MQLWERVLDKFPAEPWSLLYHGQPLDFSTKAKKALSVHFEWLILLRTLQGREGLSSRTYILDSLQVRYLKKIDPSGDFAAYPTITLLSRLNLILDSLFLYISTGHRMVMILGMMLYGCLFRDRSRVKFTGPIPYLWNAVNPGELTLDPDRRFFPWIVDGKHITKQDVLFILPRANNRKSRPDIHSSSYQALTIIELYRLIPLRILLGCVRDLALLMVKYALPLPMGLVSIQKAGYLVRIARLKPIVQHFSPTCYVTSMSDMANEDPSVVYLDSIGIKTVMYSYSATFYLPGDERCTCDFRALFFPDILASHLIVWHRDAKRFIEQHPQEQIRIKAIGPLMPGDESVFESSPHDLRARSGIVPPDKGDRCRYISVFDLAPKSKAFRNHASVYPQIYTEEYMYLFLRDMYQLLQDFDDVVLVFKPQKSFQNVLLSYSEEFRQVVQSIQDSERGFVLDDDINPWIPIAVADMCIAVPFTVPPLAGMHYGIPGLFHDPTGFVSNHRYKAISHSITHSYEQLRSKIHSLLLDNPRDNRAREALWSEAQDFIGECPGTNSSDRFREFLLELRLNGTDATASEGLKNAGMIVR